MVLELSLLLINDGILTFGQVLNVTLPVASASLVAADSSSDL